MDQHDPWTRITPAGDVDRVVGQVELPERNALPCVLTLRPRYPRSKIHVLRRLPGTGISFDTVSRQTRRWGGCCFWRPVELWVGRVLYSMQRKEGSPPHPLPRVCYGRVSLVFCELAATVRR